MKKIVSYLESALKNAWDNVCLTYVNKRYPTEFNNVWIDKVAAHLPFMWKHLACFKVLKKALNKVSIILLSKLFFDVWHVFCKNNPNKRWVNWNYEYIWGVLKHRVRKNKMTLKFDFSDLGCRLIKKFVSYSESAP